MSRVGRRLSSTRGLADIVASHYGRSNLWDRILAGLAAAALDGAQLTPVDLAPVDEFHIPGATRRPTFRTVARRT